MPESQGGTGSGQDGTLAAGDYTLVIGEFSTADPPGGAGATFDDFVANGDFGNEAVNYQLNVFHNVVPEPTTSLLLVGLGLTAVVRRRR